MNAEIVKILVNLGVSCLALIGIGWWWYRKGWPWFARLVADLQGQNRKMIEDFLKSLKRRDEINRQMIDELRGLRAEIVSQRQPAHKRVLKKPIKRHK